MEERKELVSVFVKENKHYSKDELIGLFQKGKEIGLEIIKLLRQYGVIKIVKNNISKDLSEINDEDVLIVDINDDSVECKFVFSYVGLIVVKDVVIKAYPKYIPIDNVVDKEDTKRVTKCLKQVMGVLEKYSNSKEPVVKLYNPNEEGGSFNFLAIILYLLNDYFENGIYSNSIVKIEENGEGEILWDKTINETYAILNDNGPIYPNYFTIRTITNENDYIKRLHEFILTNCSEEIKELGLNDLFDNILTVELSDETWDSFGDVEYILYKIQQELNVQFNTQKQLLLKSLYAYVAQEKTYVDDDNLSLYGTNSFNLVWEDACKVVFGNKLDYKIKDIFDETIEGSNKTLLQYIEKPIWFGYCWNVKNSKEAKDTLIPDLISIDEDKKAFRIFDAKYYNLQMEEFSELKGQPGIESITKQYLYQLAYQKLIDYFGIEKITNAFLFPTESENVDNRGIVTLPMMESITIGDKKKLSPIQVIFLPASKVFDCYLNNVLFKEDLKLDNESM